MISPLKQAPPEFMKRYNAIMSGEEKLDTAQKLKDFWLFAVEQGWPHREMREHIALLVGQATPLSLVKELLGNIRKIGGLSQDGWAVMTYFEDCEFIGNSVDPERTTEELYDYYWLTVQHAVEDIKPENFPLRSKPVQLPAKQARQIARAIIKIISD